MSSLDEQQIRDLVLKRSLGLAKVSDLLHQDLDFRGERFAEPVEMTRHVECDLFSSLYEENREQKKKDESVVKARRR